jgi:CBS-domain-containing membrane protein
MKGAPPSISPDLPVFEALDKLVDKRLAGIPVIDDQKRLVGFLTEKDCLRLQTIAHQYNLTGSTVRNIMSEIKEALHPEMDLLTAASRFLACYFATLPVLDGETLVGSISRRNMLVAIKTMHKQKGVCFQQDREKLEKVGNPSSIGSLQQLVGMSSRKQLASVFGGRHLR